MIRISKRQFVSFVSSQLVLSIGNDVVSRTIVSDVVEVLVEFAWCESDAMFVDGPVLFGLVEIDDDEMVFDDVNNDVMLLLSDAAVLRGRGGYVVARFDLIDRGYFDPGVSFKSSGCPLGQRLEVPITVS